MGWMDSKVALVTGGASGIGLAIVERFVAEGAKVCVMDRSQDGIDALEAKFNGCVVGLTGDVRSLAVNKAAVAKAVAAFGQLDTFIGKAANVTLSAAAYNMAKLLAWFYCAPFLRQKIETFIGKLGINLGNERELIA